MIWLLVPQALVLVAAVLTVSLDYYWTDRRKTEFKKGRRLLLAAVLVVGIVSLVSSYRTQNSQEHELRDLRQKLEGIATAQQTRQHDMLKRLLFHVERELDLNFQVIQLKAGVAFGLTTGLVKDPSRLELTIELIKAEKFHAMVPSIWGEDMTILAGYGPNGEASHRALLHFYDVLKATQEREADLLTKLQGETRPDWRRSIVSVLHGEYDALRAALMQTGKAVVPVMKEFGLARGYRPEGGA